MKLIIYIDQNNKDYVLEAIREAGLCGLHEYDDIGVIGIYYQGSNFEGVNKKISFLSDVLINKQIRVAVEYLQ